MAKKLLKRIRGFDLVYGKIQQQWDKKLESRRLEHRNKKLFAPRFLKRTDRDDESMFIVYY
ncbi:hypothetical protein H0V99_02450 [Candidatus Saccharibacteria bacterium]|nr:hypothetical protein [Candidatus Saccharibacteria bacterium]